MLGKAEQFYKEVCAWVVLFCLFIISIDHDSTKNSAATTMYVVQAFVWQNCSRH
jgi:hypothetical protein